MRKIISTVSVALFLLFPLAANATSSEVHITQDGKASVTSAKVMQLAGSTFFARLYWGTAYVRFLIKTTSDTKFYRATGEATTLKEVSVGDSLDITGELEYGSESLVIIASTVRNASVQKAQKVFSGKVTNVSVVDNKFTLSTKSDGDITVVFPSAGFAKGSRTLDLSHLLVGDTVTKVGGDYNLQTKILAATSVLVYIDPQYYKPRNFEGKLVSISGTTLPTSLKIKIGATEYTVNLIEKADLLSKNKGVLTLNRFVEGDSVRLYGTIREIDDPIIDADTLRNMSL